MGGLDPVPVGEGVGGATGLRYRATAARKAASAAWSSSSCQSRLPGRSNQTSPAIPAAQAPANRPGILAAFPAAGATAVSEISTGFGVRARIWLSVLPNTMPKVSGLR